LRSLRDGLGDVLPDGHAIFGTNSMARRQIEITFGRDGDRRRGVIGADDVDRPGGHGFGEGSRDPFTYCAIDIGGDGERV